MRAPTIRLPTGSSAAQRPQAPQPFRSCSPVITPVRCRRVATALPRTASCIGLATAVSGPSPETPLALPRKSYLGHTPPLRRLKYLADQTRRRFAIPAAAVVPALASAFDSEVTLLGRITARSAWVCAAFRPAILSRLNQPDFPLRKQKLGVTLPHGCSRFGSVSSESHWQALPYVFGWASHG